MSETNTNPEARAVELLAQVIFINLAGGSQWSDVVEHFKDKYRDTARAAMKAHVDALAAEGMVIVPREPTDEMVVAGDERIIEVLNDHSFLLRPKTPAHLCYEAMIAPHASASRR